ncbi:unnamed protein product [Meganyctiphanes norvegica]|uniref:Phosphatidic acid phosphatase type 2/haloperoxidase domain-containing protein n=1 Tax=Meganyctiphanes norvegica TaxID=48144 RepID=A0AAV2R4R6_MEGNR
MSSNDEHDRNELWIHNYYVKHKIKFALFFGSCMWVTMLGLVPPRPAAISCSDEKIRQSFTGDTVSVKNLLVVCLLGPFFMIAYIEFLRLGGMVGSCFKISRRFTSDLLVGGLMLFFVNDIIKTFVSEARPHFWQTCQPDLSEGACKEKKIYINWQNCTNPGNLHFAYLVDSMKSFPSGHSSISVYSGVFMLFYVNARLKLDSRIMHLCALLPWTLFPLFCCLSRIYDNRHFWWDVSGGAAMGVIGGLLSVIYLTNSFAVNESFVNIEDKSSSEVDESINTESSRQQHKSVIGDNPEVSVRQRAHDNSAS